VQPAPLADVLPKIPNARVMLLNSGSRVLGPNQPLLQRLASAGVYFEIATLEGVRRRRIPLLSRVQRQSPTMAAATPANTSAQVYDGLAV